MTSLSGGAKLEAALAKIAKNLSKASSVDVGFMEGATYPDGTSIPMVAAINEFGAPSRGQPPRPFFRSAIADNSHKWPTNIATGLKNNDFDGAKALDLVGQEIQEEIQRSIIDFSDPPNAPATIAKKGFDDPLVDKGTMLNSVTHIVK